MITNQMSPAEHISHAIRSLIEAAELTEGMLSDSGREHFASILFRVGEHVEQARAKIAADKLPRPLGHSALVTSGRSSSTI
jgi:hypothetical protein